MSARVREWLQASVAAAIFALALLVLHHELREVRYHDLLQALAGLPADRLWWALLLTAASYTVLTGYDQLAFRHLGRAIAARRVALASFVGFAISNNVGFAVLSGASVRYRFYARWGVDAADLSRVVLFYATASWAGLATLGGWSLAFHPHPAVAGHAVGPLLRGLGFLLLALVAAYLVAAAMGTPPLRIKGFELAVPSLRLALGQLVLSILDWGLAAAVLAALLPPAARASAFFWAPSSRRSSPGSRAMYRAASACSRA